MVVCGRDSRSLKTLIVGGGISGLVTVLSLHDSGFDAIRLVEAAPKILPVGAGVNLLPNAVRELSALGLYRDLSERAVHTREIHYYDRHGSLILRDGRGRGAGYDWPQLSITRGALQDVLLRAARTRLDDGCLRTGTRVTGVTTVSDGVAVDTVRDDEARLHHADLAIGADGVKSVVRRAVNPVDDGDPVWHGMVVWRGMTWARPIEPAGTMIVAGDRTHKLIAYAVTPQQRDGRALINWAAAKQFPRPEDVDRREWHRSVSPSRFADHFGHLRLDCVSVQELFWNAESCFEFPSVDREPLPTWRRGRAVVVGDAAHPMQPMGSNATTQAVLDARALAYCLATRSGTAIALDDYESHRRPIATQVQLANRDMGPESIIDVVSSRAPAGFDNVGDVVDTEVLTGISTRYARLAAFDKESVNKRSPYDVRRARLVGTSAE